VIANQKGYLKGINVGQTAGRRQRVMPADYRRAAEQVGRLTVNQRSH